MPLCLRILVGISQISEDYLVNRDGRGIVLWPGSMPRLNRKTHLQALRLAGQFDRDETRPVGRELQYDEFVQLLARHDQAIRRYARALLPTRDGVDDVVQETALECWRKFSEFSPDSADTIGEEFVRWACVIARFKALSWQRDRSRDRLVFRESVIEALAQSASSTVDRADEQRTAVAKCLKSLPADDRRLVLSVHAPGDSVARIAAETGQNARRLYGQVNALRTQLMSCVERRLAGGLGQ